MSEPGAENEPIARIEAPMEPFQSQHLCSAHDLRRGLGAAFLMAAPQLGSKALGRN
jgi:hypothetical protein